VEAAAAAGFFVVWSYLCCHHAATQGVYSGDRENAAEERATEIEVVFWRSGLVRIVGLSGAARPSSQFPPPRPFSIPVRSAGGHIGLPLSEEAQSVPTGRYISRDIERCG
jgi:hypothetical protein